MNRDIAGPQKTERKELPLLQGLKPVDPGRDTPGLKAPASNRDMLNASELAGRLRALDDLATGKLRPAVPENGKWKLEKGEEKIPTAETRTLEKAKGAAAPDTRQLHRAVTFDPA